MGSILTEQLNLNGQIYSSYVGKSFAASPKWIFTGGSKSHTSFIQV
jgi:hypothetical protein